MVQVFALRVVVGACEKLLTMLLMLMLLLLLVLAGWCYFASAAPPPAECTSLGTSTAVAVCIVQLYWYGCTSTSTAMQLYEYSCTSTAVRLYGRTVVFGIPIQLCGVVRDSKISFRGSLEKMR